MNKKLYLLLLTLLTCTNNILSMDKNICKFNAYGELPKEADSYSCSKKTQEEKDKLLSTLMQAYNPGDDDDKKWRENRGLIARNILSGANVNTKASFKSLHAAEEHHWVTALTIGKADDYNYFEFLLKNHADPNLPNSEGIYPIQRVKYIQTAQLFKQYGANFLLVKSYIGNLINIAIHYHANAELVRFYLENGVDPTETDSDGNNAIHYLADNSDKFSLDDMYKTFTCLTKANVNCNLKNRKQQAPLDMIRQKDLTILGNRYLYEKLKYGHIRKRYFAIIYPEIYPARLTVLLARGLKDQNYAF